MTPRRAKITTATSDENTFGRGDRLEKAETEKEDEDGSQHRDVTATEQTAVNGENECQPIASDPAPAGHGMLVGVAVAPDD